jgi:hypothetical protein
MSVEDIARSAISDGAPLAPGREDFEPSGALPLAVFRSDGVCAALVVRRRRDDAWITDVVVFAGGEDGDLEWRGEGGATWGDLPFEAERRTDPVGSIGHSMGWDGDRQWIAAQGFAAPGASTIELRVRGAVARTTPSPETGAYVVALLVEAEDDVEGSELGLTAVSEPGRTDRRQAGPSPTPPP